MPSRGKDAPEPDLEKLPLGHYRGRGNDQRATGPSGEFMTPGPSRYMAPPEPGDQERPTIGPWPVPGDARGYTPRTFERSDERIQGEVKEALGAHPDLDAGDIEVQVDGGVVILRGTARSRWAKFYAEDLAAGIEGVREVVNELEIAPRGAPTTG
jgi:hypothetical protein